MIAFCKYERINQMQKSHQSKLLKRFRSHREMIEQLRKTIINKKLKSVINSEVHMMSKFNLSTNDITEALYEVCDLAVEGDENMNYNLFIFAPDLNLMISNTNFIEKIISDICFNYDYRGEETTIKLIVDDHKKMSMKVVNNLNRVSSLRELKKNPSHYLMMSDNSVIDLRTNQLVDSNEISSVYDFISKSPFKYIMTSSLNESQLAEYHLHVETINRIFKDWSDEDDQISYLMKQISYSILQHDNHNRFVVLKGPGGNGKSSYMSMLSKLSGQSNTIYANIHQFGDPNSINRINSSTRLIIGDDAATNHKISDVALSNLKSIVTGDAISVPVKYSHNVNIMSNAMFVQGTNTDISFYENNPALKSRMIVINWTSTDFRSKKSTLDFNLDKLLTDQFFIDTLATMILNDVKYFDEFKIPEKVIQSTNEMIESNDTIKQFLDDVYYSINLYPKIPIKGLYKKYETWLKENNPSSKTMKLYTFTKHLSSHGQTYGFKTIQNRLRFKNQSFIKSLMYVLNEHDFSLEQQTYIEPNHPIDQNDLDNFDISTVELVDVTEKERQIICMLAYDYHRSDVMSKFHQIIS